MPPLLEPVAYLATGWLGVGADMRETFGILITNIANYEQDDYTTYDAGVSGSLTYKPHAQQ